MAKASRNTQTKPRAAKPLKASVAKSRPKAPKTAVRPVAAEPVKAAWATDLVFDVREPKLAVSLRLDADVLRFFRGLGAGYQTRINDVLKAFMQARGGADPIGHAIVSAKATRAGSGMGKRASR